MLQKDAMISHGLFLAKDENFVTGATKEASTYL